MCGDGANDCGALKAAHAGISLSEAESSVASPFTSKEANISCVPRVIREGRAALVTSFGIFKYMAAYSLTQFVTVMMLYSIDSNLTDIEFLYIDLFVITVFAFFFGRTEAFDGPLVKQPPILSLISLPPILSLLLQLFVVITIQWGSFYSIQQTPWFVPYNATISDDDDNKDVSGYENYALFTVSSMQYIILALVFSKGAPYRKSIFNNYGFLLSLMFLTGFTLYLTIDPNEWLEEKFELRLPPVMDFRLVMLAFGFVNLVLAVFIEYFIVDYLVFQKLRYKFHNIDKSRRKFLAVERRLNLDQSWPSLCKKNVIESLMPSPVKFQRNPATISEIRVECENSSLTSKIGLPHPFVDSHVPHEPGSTTAPMSRGQFGSTIEVPLNPGSFLIPKRRYNSETENGYVTRDKEQTILNEFSILVDGVATLPRQGMEWSGNSTVSCRSASVEVHLCELETAQPNQKRRIE